MAKKNLNTSSSNNLQDRLEQLKSKVYSPLKNTIDEYGDIITDLPEELPEYHTVDTQDSLQKEEGFFTKLGNKINDVIPNVDYNTSAFNITNFGNVNPNKEADYSAILDPAFATAEGFLDNDIKVQQGKLLLNSRIKDDLEFQKDFLNTQKSMIQTRNLLNQALMDKDTERIKELTPIYNQLEQEYLSNFDKYRRMAGDNRYYDRVGKQQSVGERITAIDNYITELDKEDEETKVDLQAGRDRLQKSKMIYQISPEYLKKESEDWVYQIPRGMGTSGKSMISNLGLWTASAASSYIANLVWGAPSGLAGQIIAGTGAVLGATANVALNIYNRDLESLAEVSSNYVQRLQEYAIANNINISDIAKKGREELRSITGKEYSEDPNSQAYRTNELVFEDMLAYDIATTNKELDNLTKTTKKNLLSIYDHNMVLATSDIAQTALLIPGYGKLLGNTLGKLNLAERGLDYTVKGLDKVIDLTTKKVLSNVTRKGLSKYVVDPATRIFASAGMEGVEETTQYIIGSKVKDKTVDENINLYNPFDIGKLFIENQYYGLKGMAAIAGISGDPALDNDKELVNNFKVGAAIGLLMGGPMQVYSAVNNYKGYNAGRDLARNMTTTYIQAKEDVYKYKQYAEAVQRKSFNKEAFFEGLDNLLNEQTLPENFTQEDLNKEKDNISSIYNIIHNNKSIQSLSKKDRVTGAALIKHYEDEYKNAYNAINKPNNDLKNKVEQDFSNFMELHNIPEEHRDLVKNYFLMQALSEAYSDYEISLQEFNDTEYANEESKAALEEIMLELAELNKNIKIAEELIKQNKELNKFLNNSSPLYNTYSEVKDRIILRFINEREYRKAKDKYLDILNDKKYLKETIDKYNQSIEDNAQFSNFTPQYSEETQNIQNPTIDEEEIETAVEETPLNDEDKTTEIIQPTTENSSEDNEDSSKEVITPEVAPTVDTESSKNENEPASKSSINILEEASFYDEDSYFETDPDEQIFDDSLTEEDFTETPDKQPEQVIEQEDIEEPATESIISEDPVLSIANNEVEQSESIPEQQVKDITFDSDKIDKSVTLEDVDNTLKYESDDQHEEQPRTLTVGTLFYQLNELSPIEGYKSGIELNDYVSTPGNISKAKYVALVEPADSQYGKYNPEDRSTWDNAAIKIEVIDPNGNKYITFLKTIDGAKNLYLQRGEQISEEEINKLRNLRNSIIEAKLNNPDAEITFNTITYTNGRINKQQGNRNLQEIKGLAIPTDLHNLFDVGIKFGIGKGIVGNFMIADRNGIPLNGRGGSGKIFIYPAPENTINGEDTPIQLNEQRFANEDGTATELANYLANLFIYRETGDEGLYYDDIQRLVLNYGESTLLKPGDPREEFLADKQFYINYKEGWAQLGRDRVNIKELRNEIGVQRVAQFIADNLHWNTDKTLLWSALPKSFKDYLIDTNQDHVEIVPGLEFDLEDVGLKRVNGKLVTDSEHPNGLSTLAWLIKYGKLQSNVGDRLFTEPFIYVGDPIITKPSKENKKTFTGNLLELADFGEQPENLNSIFNIFDSKERVNRAKLLNKKNIIDVFSSVDVKLEVDIKNETSDKIIGILTYDTKLNRFDFRVVPNKSKGYTLQDVDNDPNINQMLGPVPREYVKKMVDKYIPKDLQEYYINKKYDEDNKEYRKASEFLELAGIDTIDKRVAILANTNIGSDNYLRDKYGIYHINEYTSETNAPTSDILTFDLLKEKYYKSKEEYDPFTDPNSKDVMNFFNLNAPDGPTKRMSVKETEKQKKINTVKATKWLKDKLGLTDDQIDIIDGLLYQFSNGEAVYGIAHADGIAISNMSIDGVQYHEAWHRVSLLYLDEDTREKLYNEYLKLNPNLSNLSRSQIEESIADSFMDYMLTDKENKFRYYINKIFRNIKKLLGFQNELGKASLKEVFDMIKYGDFAKYKLNEKSLKSFMESYGRGAYYKVGKNLDISLKHFPTIHEFESALDSLKACLFIANGAKYLSDISKLDNGKLKAFLQNYSKSKFVTEELRNALNEIIDNFDIFIYHLQPRLEQMGIRALEQNANKDFQERETSGIQNYDKATYEFDKKNNALASVKMFIATLADTYFDENNILRTKINNITGLPMIVDYDEAYSLILNNLSTIENYSPVPGKDPNTSLLGRCSELSKHNPFFAFLYKRLNSVIDSNLETQILQTIKSFNLNFIESAYSTDNKGNATFVVKDTINKLATKTFPSTWSDLFFNSDLIIQSNDKIEPNKEKINQIITSYNKLFNDVKNNTIINNADSRKYINELVKLLNNIGIDVDEITIEGLLDQTNRIESLKELITTTKQGSLYHLFNGTLKSTLGGNQTYTVRGVQKVRSLDSVYMGLGVNNIIHELSQVQAITHPNDTGISALGPNNNLVYTKTLNCYVSDLIRWLNLKDDATITNLNNDPYCKSSLILLAANEGSYLRLNTFLNFYGDQHGDKGRDYLSISPVEDYINKINLTWNNHIIFPTMADKKTWFTITGINLFNKEMSIKQEGNKIKLLFNRDALRYLYSAWLDEYNAIVNYYNTLSSVKSPIKNYHTSGKGGLFRHFTGYYVNKNGQNVWVDLNEQIKEAISLDKEQNTSIYLLNTLNQIKEDLFTSPLQTYNKINNNLLIELQTELDTCERLGIIEKDGNNQKLLKNKLLDSKIFEHFTNIYKSNINPNISLNAERYAIITILGNHVINQNVSTLETEKIITGDVAFYKNDDDKIKRLGAVLSTGDNLRDQWLTSDPNKIDLYRHLNNRNTYTCAIFNDNEIPSTQYDLIKDLFEYDNFRNLLIERENLSESQVDELMKDEANAKKQYPELAALASTLAIEDASAYGLNGKRTKGNINQADAAVYIRPEMYEQIVRRLGEWSPEVEEAFKILESDEDWLSNKDLYSKSLKTLIKALKTTYFGYTYNTDLGYNVPIFNKMAMFPMFKALATGDNREIYDRMNAVGKYKGLQPIDQIAFESAVKVGIEGGFNFYSDYTNNSINDMTNIHTTTQYFRNLRRQLITDPHTHDRTLFGTLVSTVAVSNLIMDRTYGNENNPESLRTGEQLKEQLFGTINALSNKGMLSVRNEFMTDGELDLDKTSKSLIREAHSSNMGKSIEDALQYNSDELDFEVSLAALPDSKWVETKIIANTNHKAIDLELPGGAFIQMSSFGFKSIKTVGSNAIANGKRLLNINEDGSMDAIISINLFRHVIPNFDNISFTEAKEWLKKAGIIYDEENPNNSKPIAIGYRIPTQGLSSIAGLRIKDVLPSNVGDMIVLPDEFTTQTGSDFDIDKLYIARYNFDENGNKIEFKGLQKILTKEGFVLEESFENYLHRRFAEETGGSYEVSERGTDAVEKLYNSWLESIGNPTNVYEANSREANENLLLDTYLTVLTDKKVVDLTRLPLDKVTGIIKDEILPIVDGEVDESKHVPFKELSPTYQMNKKYEYSGGKTGIGPFALNNKNHILTQLANLRFAENPLLQALGFTGLDGINSKDETVYKRDSKGNIIYENDSPIMVEDKGLRILDWISAMINAHVDVAKDPYVIRLNVRQYTYNICNFLLRVGYGKSTFYFLPQRILKDMAVAYEAASGIYGVNNSKSKTATVNLQITDIRKKYFKLYEDACKEANVNLELSQDNDGSVSFNDLSVSFNLIASKIIDRDNLITLLQDDKKLDKLSASEKANYYKQLLLISELFLQLNDLAQDMSKLVQLSQIDTKRYGNNFVELNRFLYRLNSLIVNTSLFNSEDIINYYRDTFLETKLINGIIEPASIFQSLMFRSNDGFKNSISRILLMTNRIDTNDEALNKTISNELEGQLRYRFLLHKEINVFDMLYGENSMAHRLAKIKSDVLNGKYDGMLTQDGKIANKLLNHLGTLTRMSTDKYIAPNVITRNRINDGDKYLKQTLSTYWEELLDSPYEEIRLFANDLFYYQLATTAGNFSKNGIFNITPIRLIKESGYNQFMRNSVKMFSANTDIDYDNFFLNNWQNNKIVKPVLLYKEAYDPDANEIVQQLTVPVLFSNQQLPLIKKRYPILMQLNNPSIAKNEYGEEVFLPYVKIVLDKTTPAGTLLYKLIGTVKNKLGISKPIYALVNKKGLNESGRVVKEYDNYSNSMFDFNNIENALNAKESITLDAINQLLSAGDKNAVKQWLTAISKIDYIHDYIPETKALSLNAFSLESRPSRSVRDYTRTDNIKEMKNSNDVSEQTNTSVSTFIFNDGFSVNIPFTLNEQQIELLHTLESFYNNPKAYGNILTVSGYAGTGKTTIIGIFNKWLEHKYEQAIFSSPTHRANAVTKMNNPNAVVATLHSIFGLSPIVDLESGNYDLRKLKTELVYKPKIKPNQLLIIDESSMVSNGLYNFIQDYVKASGIKVIFLGDQALLSPVKDNSISPVFTENDSKIELTKVERTGDNPILTEATSLRNGNDLSYQTNIINGEGVEYIPTNSQRVDDILNTIVNSDEFKNNPLHFKVLAATNAVVQQTNLKVREQRYGKNAPQLMVGDILMGYSNITDEDVELVRNSVDYIVDSVSEKKTNTIKVLDGKSITVEGYDIVLRNAFNGEVQDKIFVLDNNVSQNKLNEISDLIEYFNRAINDAFKSHNYRIIGALQQALSEILRNTILMKDVLSGSALKIRKTLDYGYACTVHKSQGGTYNKIMYYADTVAPFEKKVQNQLDYVAVSRAKENVYIVTNHEIKEQMSKDITTETNDQLTIVQTHNETLLVLGGVSDEIANSEMKDAIKIAKEGITFESALSTVNPIFNNTEIQQIKLNGASLKVMSVSRYTDPAFFANEIVKFLEENAKKSFTDPTRVNVIELWTKHDGEPIQKILQACKKYKVAPMVSFSITTLGNTPLEQGVLEYKTLLDLIRKLVESKDLDPRTTTIRIDPILPGYTNMDDIKDVIRIGKSIGIRKYVTSLVQSYGYLDGTINDRKVTSGINNALAKVGQTYDWDTYYGRITYGKNKGKINFIPKQQYIDLISEVLLDINKDPEIRLETCSFTIKGLKASACLDPLIIERVTGVDVTRLDGTYDRDTSRPDCMCYGCHGDKFRWNEKQCFSSCAYCYAAHSGDSNFNYYNADGTLKDRPLTRVNNNFIGNDGTDNANQTRQMVNIYSGTGDNVDLSNFAERPFVYQNTRFKTVEGAFLALKLNYSNYIDSSMSLRYIEMLNKFANATGYEARTLGRSISSLDRQTWDRDSESILKESMKASFEQNTNAKQRLLNTGDAILTHKDKYGKELDNGRFSRLLMEIREEFRNEPQSLKYTGNLLEQADFSEFNEMREEGKKIADVCKGK